MDTPSEFFTVSRVCELTGLQPDRLQEVETTFLEHLEVRRTPGGNRLFSARDVDRLQEIQRMVDNEGLSLDQVKATLFPPAFFDADPADTLPVWNRKKAASLKEQPVADGPEMPVEAPSAVEPLPVEPTVDLLLEAAEGLVQENLRLRQAVDSLGERFMKLEQRLATNRGGFFQRLFGRG
jgi:DNA-binding transcriptional MerR regulator